MQVEIYRRGDGEAYAALPKGAGEGALPNGRWAKLREVVLEPDDQRIGLDAGEALESIRSDGVYLFGGSVKCVRDG